MALKLTVLSEQRTRLGARASIVFGVGGGSIGRAHDNDWVLPDPQRYLSAHHARIRFADGAFHLMDTSTNGVFINDSPEALGRRGSHILQDGDRVRLGDYELSAHIDTERAEAPEASAVFPLMPRPATQAGTDLGADLSMGDLLSLEGSGGATDDPGLLAFDRSERSGRVRTTAARGDHRGPEQGSAFEMFCRGAGVDPAAVGADSPARLLQLAGQMLREALVGLKGLALAQREQRDRQQIEVGREDPQRIGLTGLPVEDLMLRLLQGHEAHQLDAVQWVRETLAGTRLHDQAMARALRAALAEFLPRLEPRSLCSPAGQRRIDPGELAGMSERFQSITDMAAGELPHLFREALARHFAAEFRGPGAGEPPSPLGKRR